MDVAYQRVVAKAATGVTLPVKATPGLVVADNVEGKIWACDRPENNTAYNIYEMSYNDTGELTLLNTYPTPAPEVGITYNPQAIILQPNEVSSKGVVAVWISDKGSSQIFKITPATAPGKAVPGDVKVLAGLPTGFSPSGLAWDKKNKKVWVSGPDNGNILPVDTTNDKPGTALTVSEPTCQPTALAVSDQGDVWYAGYQNGTVGVFKNGTDTDNPPGGMNGPVRLSTKDSLPVSIIIDKSNVWVLTAAEAALWKLSSTTTSAQQFYKFPQGSSPQNMALDGAGYLWVSTKDDTQEFDTRGAWVETYVAYTARPEPDKEALNAVTSPGVIPSLPSSPIRDFIWLSDTSETKLALYRLTPRDQLLPNITPNDWTIDATPDSGGVEPGNSLDKFTVTTRLKGRAKGPRSIWLSVAASWGVNFSSGSQTKTVVTDYSTGQADISDLSVDAGAAVGEFVIYANTRGWPTPKPIYNGLIGQAATNIQVPDDHEEYAFINRQFLTPLQAKVTPPGAPVTFQIDTAKTTEATEARFSNGELTYVASSNSSTGIASAALEAGSKTGVIHVNVKPTIGPVTAQTFKDRTVTTVPAKVTFSKKSIQLDPGQPNQPVTVTVTDITDKAVPGAMIALSLTGENAHLYDRSKDAGKPGNSVAQVKNDYLVARVKNDGTLKLSGTDDYYLYGATGATDMWLEVVALDPVTGTVPDVLAKDTMTIR